MASHDDHFHCYDHAGKGALEVRKDTFKRGGSGPPDLSFYSLKKDLKALEARSGGNARLKVLATTPSGKRDLLMLEVGQKPGGPQPHVLITGCQHAREWISASYTYLVAEWLVDNAAASGSKLSDAQKTAKKLCQENTVCLVPMVNPDGHDYSVTVERLWRKNDARGDKRFRTDPTQKASGPVAGAPESVDLNRNYDIPGRAAVLKLAPPRAWSTDKDDDDFVGTATAFEVATVQKLIKSLPFEMVVDYHCFSCAILTMPGDVQKPLPGADGKRYAAFTKEMKALLDARSAGRPTLLAKDDSWSIFQASLFYADPKWGLTRKGGPPAPGARMPGTLPDFLLYNPPAGAKLKPLCLCTELNPMMDASLKPGAGFQMPEGKIKAVFQINLGTTLALIANARNPLPKAADFAPFLSLP